MASRNNSESSLWQKIQEDSVSWGALILWIFGLAVMLILVTMFASV